MRDFWRFKLRFFSVLSLRACFFAAHALRQRMYTPSADGERRCYELHFSVSVFSLSALAYPMSFFPPEVQINPD
jgi:hypothetical protein